jgi:Tfp pilus assembly protein PilW
MPRTIEALPPGKKGITLIELVIAIAISLVAFLVVAVSYSVGLRSFTQEMSRSDILLDGQKGLESITEELRECLNITSAGSNSVTFWWRDLNENETMDAGEVVSYAVSSQVLRRTRGSTVEPVAKNVSVLRLNYDNPADPSLITVILTMQKEGNLVTLEGKASLRNK